MIEPHRLQDCPQEKRLERIEMVTDGTVKQLAQLNLTLISIDTKLSGKISVYDKHVDDGERWRGDMFRLLLGACTAGMGATVGFGIWVGALANQIHVNTDLIHQITQIKP